MTDTTSIALNKLTTWDGNVRKTAGADTALAELAASIAAHGLLQSFVVRKGKKDTYAVVAGGRRLAALQSLAESGRIEADYAVPCQLIAADADAAESALPRTPCGNRCTPPMNARPSAISATRAYRRPISPRVSALPKPSAQGYFPVPVFGSRPPREMSCLLSGP
jgi:hypothetical protein